MQPKCIIVHGCPDDSNDPTYNEHWMPWLKKQLTQHGIETKTPVMPSPWSPNYNEFRAEFEKLDSYIDENTILVGHSCGCAFLVRWLGETKRKISKLILVAPWKVPQKSKENRDVGLYDYEIDKSIQDRVDKIIMFTANNEELGGKESLKIFHNALGGKVIELEDHGHYTLADMGTEEFPELLNEILYEIGS